MAVRAIAIPKACALSGTDALITYDVVFQSTAGEIPDNVALVQDFQILIDVEVSAQDQTIQAAAAIRAHSVATWGAAIGKNQVSLVDFNKA